MSSCQKGILSIVLICVATCGTSCTRTRSLTAVRCPKCPVVVSIYTDRGDCDVDAPLVNIRKHLNNAVQWIAVDNKPYVIQFRAPTGAPSPDDQFAVPTAGPLTIDAQDEGYYEYDIYAGTIGQVSLTHVISTTRAFVLSHS
jgi:hypothetical protein